MKVRLLFNCKAMSHFIFRNFLRDFLPHKVRGRRVTCELSVPREGDGGEKHEEERSNGGGGWW